MKASIGLLTVATVMFLAGCGEDKGNGDGGTATDDPSGINSGGQPDGGGSGGGTGIGTGSGSGSGPVVDPTRADCIAKNGFWYDVADVTKTTLSGFASLKPSCHETSVEGCPTTGVVPYAKRQNGTLVNMDVTSSWHWLYGENADQIYSTIRCVQSSNYLTFDFSGNALTSLDVSVVPGIRSLYVAENPDLATLLLPKNMTSLKNVDFSSTKIPFSVVNGMPQLQELSYRNHGFTTLDLSALTALESLDLSDTDLTQLDLSHNTQLTTLTLGSTPVTNFSAMPSSLTSLTLDDRTLTNFVPNFAANLEEFSCYSCQMQTANLSYWSKLTRLQLSSNSLDGLDLSSNDDLEYLFLGDNTLQALDVSNLPHLRSLNVSNNQLPSIAVTANAELAYLDIGSNPIAALDVTQNTDLYSLDASDTLLSTLNVTQNVELETLDLRDNGNLAYDGVATKLDLHTLANLRTLDVKDSPVVLNFETGVTIHAAFLANPDAQIYTSEANWNARTGPNKPMWNFDMDWGYAGPDIP